MLAGKNPVGKGRIPVRHLPEAQRGREIVGSFRSAPAPLHNLVGHLRPTNQSVGLPVDIIEGLRKCFGLGFYRLFVDAFSLGDSCMVKRSAPVTGRSLVRVMTIFLPLLCL